uniref:Uncharacterized protein n=1 Tax=Chrysotila carterae TaxID=13221 RepID=A0A7S4BGH2_CHRCT|mmetsp:Transcript_22383/g.48867  ORF Transcript_22383/g.48867 Transcript_22383/m.48867 type:complete len:304 (+) Transcript_22383:73-984(+)
MGPMPLLLPLLLLLAPLSTAMRVLVTGANKGIGRAIAQAVLEAQPEASVLLGSRNMARGEEAAAVISKVVPGGANRIDVVQLDVTDAESVRKASERVAEMFGTDEPPLYGIVNNAGIGFGKGFEATLETNLYGAKRVCDAFLPLLSPSRGRIVNIASASGPMFVSGCSPDDARVLIDPEVTWEAIEKLLSKYRGMTDYDDSAYGLSKACLSAYTKMMANAHPSLKINSVTPGFINTDLTRGMGATNPPEKGTKAPLYCLFGELEGNGRFYGSDAQRSPLDRYRAPGSPPYEELELTEAKEPLP